MPCSFLPLELAGGRMASNLLYQALQPGLEEVRTFGGRKGYVMARH